MAIITTDNRHYRDIANAIREKNGTRQTYKPEKLAAAVETLRTDPVFPKSMMDYIMQNGQFHFTGAELACSSLSFPMAHDSDGICLFIFDSFDAMRLLPDGLDALQTVSGEGDRIFLERNSIAGTMTIRAEIQFDQLMDVEQESCLTHIYVLLW